MIGIKSNAENLKNDEAEESEEDQKEKVINEDEESGGAMIPLPPGIGHGLVQFFNLRHCRVENGGFRSSPLRPAAIAE
ncbi:hypothetical protein VNO77_28535 [Canavalia gladiata]|uniref:Uncharacterized protein n=1 Tax=Canavalia gladiata TaxID=3824 RepID=A0AAN9KW70_CANGL